MSTYKCQFNFCTSTVHTEENCFRTIEAYFTQKYYGVTYIVCPFCTSFTTLSFDRFMMEHGSHLKGFSEGKKEILIKGTIIY